MDKSDGIELKLKELAYSKAFKVLKLTIEDAYGLLRPFSVDPKEARNIDLD